MLLGNNRTKCPVRVGAYCGACHQECKYIREEYCYDFRDAYLMGIKRMFKEMKKGKKSNVSGEEKEVR